MNLAAPMLVLAARLILWAVFTVAAATKLRDRRAVSRGLVEFGVPERLAAAATVLLIACELAVAAALLFDATALAGAIGATLLLLAFTTVVTANLARGNRPACRCFGAAKQRPIGWDTVGRNVALLALGIVVAAHVSETPLLSTLGAFVELLRTQGSDRLFALAGSALLASLAFVLWQVVQQQGRILARLEMLERGDTPEALGGAAAPSATGLAIGSPAPDFELATPDGSTAKLTKLGNPEGARLLLFVNPKCGPCQALRPEVAAWQNDYASALTIVAVSEGTAAENRESPILHNVLLQREREVADAYRVYGTPAAVLLEGGRIVSQVAQGAGEIRALVSSFFDGRPQPALAMGDELPRLTLENADGEAVALHDALAEETAIVFWNPQCGFCANMLGDLHAWESEIEPRATRLLIVSNQPLDGGAGLRSPVLIDRNVRLGSACGATGTPMAVRVNSHGLLTSSVVAGRDAVLALLRREPARR